VYPICLDIVGKHCLVVGGGLVAYRKVKGLLAAGAKVLVISPEVVKPLSILAQEGKVELFLRGYQEGDGQGAFLIFAATNNSRVQELVRIEAVDSGQLFNLANDPDGCTFQVPAVVRRGDLLLTVSTSGKSPAVAAMVRKQLEREYGPEYQQLVEIITQLRGKIKGCTDNYPELRNLFEKILHPDIVKWLRQGRTDLLSEHLRVVLGTDYNLDLSRIEKRRT